LFASVAPLVKTISLGAAPMVAATCSRASSIIRRAARPKPCTEDGLPVRPSAARTTSAASGRMGTLAL
jgi:hypothetical protein